MGVDNSSLLNRLRTAVKKIKFLMKFSLNRWRLASMIGASSSRRKLSFNERPGLIACTEEYDQIDRSISSSPSFGRLHRSISYQSEDDIDKRAEMFIENFHRQLRIERQISLELKYCRGDSFQYRSP
ncbi:hypothetical protein ACFE04_008090 [Oxalis oulophora]